MAKTKKEDRKRKNFNFKVSIVECGEKRARNERIPFTRYVERLIAQDCEDHQVKIRIINPTKK